jgi:hypothetical protein
MEWKIAPAATTDQTALLIVASFDFLFTFTYVSKIFDFAFLPSDHPQVSEGVRDLY